ncbi:MAG TPA: TolC family protein, partial [Gemmatimonadaceae bacterium]|nr:TolC family protein [Gemmatimonadaceae bacterium]
SILALLAPLAIGAQSPARTAPTAPRATLSLEDAITLARRNNPVHLSTINNRRTADAAVRSAFGQLLPSADASFNAQRQEGGRQIFNGGSFGASSDVNQSSYQIGFGYRLNRATLVTPRLQRANRDAVEADITGSQEQLRGQVIQQYLSVLQAEARADLQDSLLVAARNQVVLAQARSLVGSGTELDVQRAEVASGQAQVGVLQARNQIEIEKLRLFQLMGVEQPANVVLTTEFTVTTRPLPLAILLSAAREANPVVLALRSREKVADLNVKRARGEYSPTLSVNTGISGYTYSYANPNFLINQGTVQATEARNACVRAEEVRAALNLSNNLAACNAIAFTPDQAAIMRRDNRQFPFRFQQAPKSLSATLSLPIFDGFAREQRLQEAQAASSDARYNVRARELALTADVTAAYLTLTTAARTAALQAQNSAKARLELKFTQDRYRSGAVNFVDVTESRAAFERAETDRINAIFDYHKAYAALESAVGRPLR